MLQTSPLTSLASERNIARNALADYNKLKDKFMGTYTKLWEIEKSEELLADLDDDISRLG